MSTSNTTPYPTITRRPPEKAWVEGFFDVPNGRYLVTIHEKRVVKIASVDWSVPIQKPEQTEACQGQKETRP